MNAGRGGRRSPVHGIEGWVSTVAQFHAAVEAGGGAGAQGAGCRLLYDFIYLPERQRSARERTRFAEPDERNVFYSLPPPPLFRCSIDVPGNF